MSEIKSDWEPKTVLSVKIVEYKDLVYGWFSGNNPYTTVNCPWLEKKQKYTTLVKHNVTTDSVNETFRFVIPDHLLDIKQLVEISVSDQGRVWDGTLATFVFDASSLEFGKILPKTFVIDKKGGELVVEFSKYLKEKPDFRLSVDICKEEKEFRNQRIPKVKDAIEAVFQNEEFYRRVPEFDLKQTPVMSVVGSGGGYRAAVGMSGGMAALKDAGVLDTLTYTSGLSGSSWYLCSAYAQDGVRNENQKEYHKWLQRQMENSVVWSAAKTLVDSEYRKFSSLKEELCQPCGAVDRFGYAIGKNLLDDKLKHTMSHIRATLSDGDVPYPILSSAHFKGEVASNEFHVHIENTPHEISMPRLGVNIATEQFGSHWDEGVVTRECPEFPLHYYLGSCGCAFSILLKSYMHVGSEADPELLKMINELKSEPFRPHSTTLAKESRQIGLMAVARKLPVPEEPGVALKAPRGIIHSIKQVFSDRTYLVDRTAEVNSFAHNLNEELPSVYDEPSTDNCDEDLKKIVEELEIREHQDIDREREHLSVCDAGIVKNVNVECFLRKPRFSDLIIVFDMNGYGSDEDFNYMPIIQSAVHASQNGLPFPPIQIKRLVHEPPAEFLVFESSSDDCPTVLWFTLCNKSFRELEEYEPKMEFDESMNHGRPYNDFPVFGKGTNYATKELSYSELHFQQLHDLMYHNVASCMPYIKHHISQAVQRKKRREMRNEQMQTQKS